MTCCDLLEDAIERGAFYFGAKHRIDDGRIVNDLNTEYFIRAAAPRGFDYWGVNYCPFCGRALSLGLWPAGESLLRSLAALPGFHSIQTKSVSIGKVEQISRRPVDWPGHIYR